MLNLESNWKAHIVRGIMDLNVRVYLLNAEKEYVSIARPGKDGVWEISQLQEGQMDVEPSLIFPAHLWQAIEKEVFKQPSPKQEVVDAELKATKYHLEDMRRMALFDKFEDPTELLRKQGD